MLCIPFQIFRVTAVVKCQGSKKAEVVFVGFAVIFIEVQGGDSAIFHHVVGQTFSTTNGVIFEFGDKERDVGDLLHHPFGIGATLADPFCDIEVC